MIPAILSCVYVIYLYRMLNDKEPPTSSGTTLQSLNAQVDALQARLNSLLETKGNKTR